MKYFHFPEQIEHIAEAGMTTMIDAKGFKNKTGEVDLGYMQLPDEFLILKLFFDRIVVGIFLLFYKIEQAEIIGPCTSRIKPEITLFRFTKRPYQEEEVSFFVHFQTTLEGQMIRKYPFIWSFIHK